MRLLFLAALLVVAGCQDISKMLESRPSARISGVRFSDLNLQSAGLVFDVELSNPYSVPLPLTNLEYSLASSDTPFLTGKADVQGSVPAKASKTVSVPATVSFAQLLGAVKTVRPGSVVPYEAKLNCSVDAPAVGTLNLPVSRKGELPIPAAPSVELSEIKWDRLTFDQAAATVRLKVGNRNDFPLDLSRLSLNLSLANTPIVTTEMDKSVSFKPGQENTLEIPISFAPKNLGLAAFQMLRGQGGGYHVSGRMFVNTAFGAINLPYERTGETRFR